jgi:serine/threonine protein kinase
MHESLHLLDRITLKELFPGTEYEEILALNKKCKIDLSILAMHKASFNAIDLIKKMLTIYPKDRPTAKECLQHPFFTGKDDNTPTPMKKEGF